MLEGQRVSRRFREVEVELIDGDEKALRRLAKELRKAGAHETGELQPKLYRALDLNGAPEPPELTKDTPPGEALGIALEADYRALLAHDPGTRRGDDPEDLHQLRVATRRLRAFLRAARPLVDREWAESLREELGWLGGHLGPARDLDVMLDRLRAEVAALGRRRRCGGRPARRRSRTTAPTPTGMSSRRCGAIATSRCSTGSRPRPSRRSRARRRR